MSVCSRGCDAHSHVETLARTRPWWLCHRVDDGCGFELATQEEFRDRLYCRWAGAVDSWASPTVLLHCPSSCDVVLPLRCCSLWRFDVITCSNQRRRLIAGRGAASSGCLDLPVGSLEETLRVSCDRMGRNGGGKVTRPTREPFILVAIALLPDNRGPWGASLGLTGTALVARETLCCAVVCVCVCVTDCRPRTSSDYWLSGQRGEPLRAC